MRIRSDLPRPAREIENVWIPMADGTRLAAKVWLPEDSEVEPVPAILEYIPYRKNDWTWLRDSTMHPYFAGHGYACLRVDLRGAGDSDGILLDEYLKQEQDDAVEAIAWIAAQPWCTGAVGMFGISWGGFNGLQVAARRPPALKTVITLCSTDDRYADDVHYMGGCVLGVDMLPWASAMHVWNGTPPDPANVGDDWRETWLKRLKETPPYIEAWLAHQRRDAYWQHGSVCEDFSAIECPVYAIGGWVDGYSNAIPRLLEGLPGISKGLIGPWGHGFPHDAFPGPQIGFLQECLRWWDRWLKGKENGVEKEPALRAWMQDATGPNAQPDERPGRWVAEPTWPRSRQELRRLGLGDGTLDQSSPREVRLDLLGAQACGLDAGLWCPYGDALDQPPDQRSEDGLSLTFDSPPLEEPFELFGFPEAVLALAVDRPRALVAVRLCDVAPNGQSTLVTRGLLNLTHRESHEEPKPLEPGRDYEVRVRLNAIAHSFPVGHRLRLAVSPTYWPWAWPSPEPVTLSLSTGSSRLELPVRLPQAADLELVPFQPPEGSAPIEVDELAPASAARRIEHDVASGAVTLTYEYGGGRRVLPNGIELEDVGREIFTIVEGDPLSARVRCEGLVALGRGDWRTRVETASEMWCDADHFHTRNRIEAFESGEKVHEDERTFSVPRDLV
ncbi:MAG TPA: CocE/NonD family hydrolase [Gaiellaceae bacterium]|nr:CocE/NonD family hydrolase [Gaiellaceae bacterium]